MKPVLALPLTQELFQSYGTVLDVSRDDVTVITANKGSARKYLGVSEALNDYSQASVPHCTGRWNLFQSKPTVPIVPAGQIMIRVDTLERHPYTTQTFTPMGRSADEPAYLVVVAPNADDDGPDWTNLKVFIAFGTQAITYDANVWHSPMLTIGKPTVLTAFNYENGIMQDDCQVKTTSTPVPVVTSNELEAAIESASK
ncbi:ureidoglycolate hydrolase [Schizosaccharomyces japonicus yFS275]|uniref:Ureidoglycolate hydrolase n=1 Tax=Schizosaccharomyces japonicus (strain yFS275 / FY16936) TaxID=402676 RepID=B6K331_SCHJY|nr:ureidoglycolate hydrolase [Schizosaccharomyces japonicus yFS275]EEB07888.1 ureidoglycolate hydrolase [Schizosaccharomyces japonicus yFS275]